MPSLYTLVLRLGLVLYAPAALWRRVVHRVPVNLRERLGRGARPLVGPGPRGWLHAVSVGEAIAAEPIVQGLVRLYPGLPLVVTTVTPTGARVVRERFGAIAAHRFFPLDLPGAVRRAVDAIEPAFLICMETELWPNLFRALAARGVPIMIANGRLSDRSYRGYRMLRAPMRRVLRHVTVFGMRSEEDARRMIALGAPPERVVITGNVKHEPLGDVSGVAELWSRLLGLRPSQPVWIAGSTHRGEEAIVLDAHAAAKRVHADVVLVLAPRHPERVPEVVELVRGRGWPAVRRSELPRERKPGAVIVLDTVGELPQLYSVADVVFVGGSLVPLGGHNMLEPALRRKPVLFGPHTANFREEAALLAESGGGLVVADGRRLAAELVRLLADGELRAKLGQVAFEAVAARHGAVRATLELVARFLRPPAEA
jgi:3-deoxy-D-manno-octulosonic-acid transferase